MKWLIIHVRAIYCRTFSSYVLLALFFGSVALLRPDLLPTPTLEGIGLGMWRLLAAAVVIASIRYAYRLMVSADAKHCLNGAQPGA
ncbi:hypothetical protein FHW79_006314 [Azospirillum sp. OGB3]|uniref:hypothetical protein n=1 Tax=Azospirillum sp. OGB3 TaxID=2587012 RepID=UPI001606574E|nr:hypothetical protein [Azospirillum sp. OGB3]MBB3268639.1 hypothetical protein [Azospirillum sp. OGB3]